MLRRLALPAHAWPELKRHAEARGVLFLSTPFDDASAELLNRLSVAAFKIASGEVTNHPFLERIARYQRPLLLSTGMSDLAEVEGAVAAMHGAGATEIGLFHCTSSYPAPIDAVNLRAIETLRRRFDVPVGYSDHTLGNEVSWAAAALGADLLEKHLTLDRSLIGPDHAASMEPRDFAAMVRGVRAINAALGDGDKRVQPCELEVQRVARRSLFARRDLPAGHALTPEDVVCRRPANGLPPSALGRLLGRSLGRAVARDTLLREPDFD
jgi:sialic acid synthase SpsE